MRTKPKKRLGQNFLFDRNVLNKIVLSLGLKADDLVLEIGAGRGELTALVAASASLVLAVEIDRELCLDLASNLKDHPNARIVNADILKLSIAKYLRAWSRPVKVVGNIPYYISTPIITRLFKYHKLISGAYLTVQKEFAERIVARPGSKDYGSLSCFVQYYSQPRIVFNISRNCFFPRPKVDSSLLELRFRKNNVLSQNREKRLFKLVRSAFNKRRKTLRNSLSGVVKRQELDVFFEKYSIRPDVRPEDLALDDFINLMKIKKNQKNC